MKFFKRKAVIAATAVAVLTGGGLAAGVGSSAHGGVLNNQGRQVCQNAGRANDNAFTSRGTIKGCNNTLRF